LRATRVLPKLPIEPQFSTALGATIVVAMRDNMHDRVVANENMAKVLAAKSYHYQFVFARNAGHVDSRVKQQTLPEALEWLWHDYQPVAK
jgi:hypothetical protein